MLKRFVEPFLVACFLIAVILVAVQGIRVVDGETRAVTANALRTVLKTVEESLHFWARSRIKDARTIASQARVVELTQALLRAPRNREALIANDAVRQMRDEVAGQINDFGYPGFVIIAPDYITLASMRDENIGTRNLIANHMRSRLDRVFADDSVIIPAIRSDIPLQPQVDKRLQLPPTMFAAAPIIGPTGEVIAAFAIRLDPIGDFSSLTRLGRIGSSGETYAFNKQRILISESRFSEQLREIGLIAFEQNSILNVHISDPGGNLIGGYKSAIPVEKRPPTVMAASAIQGQRGYSTDGYRDYRGVPVFGAWRWNQELGIGLTTEIDAEEALQPFYSARRVISGVLAVTTILALLLVIYLIIVRMRALRTLESGQAILEGRVKERTQELLSINEKLQDQVVERVRAEERLKTIQGELEDSNRKLEDLAMVDGLTGVANRRAFDKHMEAEWKRCLRTEAPLSLVMFDIDHFKLYNDTYGHQAGDACLKKVGQNLTGGSVARRPGDLLARYGGEEFAVILSNCSEEHAADIGEQLRAEIAALKILHEASGVVNADYVTLSVGVGTLIPTPDTTFNSLIEITDRALYMAKEQGRNRRVSAGSGPRLAVRNQ